MTTEILVTKVIESSIRNALLAAIERMGDCEAIITVTPIGRNGVGVYIGYRYAEHAKTYLSNK